MTVFGTGRTGSLRAVQRRRLMSRRNRTASHSLPSLTSHCTCQCRPERCCRSGHNVVPLRSALPSVKHLMLTALVRWLEAPAVGVREDRADAPGRRSSTWREGTSWSVDKLALITGDSESWNTRLEIPADMQGRLDSLSDIEGASREPEMFQWSLGHCLKPSFKSTQLVCRSHMVGGILRVCC